MDMLCKTTKLLKKAGYMCLLGLAVIANAAFADSGESRTIPYPASYNTESQGASSYNGIANVKKSPYFTAVDYYNLPSTKSLTLLSHYKTYQQTTEITCGPAAALTVLYHFGETSWDEKKIARVMGTKPEVGTDTSGMVTFFKQLGWDVQSSLASGKNGKTFLAAADFNKFIVENLKNNTPIMVENIDWGGHWRVIIGYDTMGTETQSDDVLIMADSYDTADHQQDGYVVTPAEKFFYMWFDAHMLPKDYQQQPWLVVKPAAK